MIFHHTTPRMAAHMNAMVYSTIDVQGSFNQ